MSEAAPAASVVRRMVDEVWNDRDLSVVDALFAPDFDNGPGLPPGPEGVRTWHRSTWDSFPDLRYQLEAMIAQGSEVAIRWTATGTQRGQFGPIPPTGRTITYAGAHFLTVEDGRITRLWSINDTFGKVLELGAELVPPDPHSANQHTREDS